MTQARFMLNEQTTRVLDVIKGKYGLKNRNEALHRVVQEHGDVYIEPAVNESTLEEMDILLENQNYLY
jgi:hypothetical protein